MTGIRQSATQQNLLRNAQFQPVFDDSGNIIGLHELKVASDRRDGMKSMRELFETVDPSDTQISADGFTGKQKRIIRQRAPMAAHYLKPSRKWDARTGTMRDGVLIQLPYEVVWTLFELLFEGQYSIRIRDIEYESEEISEAGSSLQGAKAEDAPGRLFYARATVQVEIHPANNQPSRVFEGVGVSYGDVPVEKTGNIFAINNARRTAEKGAVADAKREALSHIGPVFRRAFEDGDDMIDHIEKLLLEEIRERNKPAIHQASASRNKIPAPQRKSPETDGTTGSPRGDSGTPDRIRIHLPGSPDRLVGRENLAAELVNSIFETCASREDYDTLIASNHDVLAAIEDTDTLDEIRRIGEEFGNEDTIPDFELPGNAAAPQAHEAAEADTAPPRAIRTEDKDSETIHAELAGMLGNARTEDDRNAIIEANGPAIRKLTPQALAEISTKPAKPARPAKPAKAGK